MRRDIEKRLEAVENRTLDWVSKLDVVDYGILDDYKGDEWEELHFDSTITVVRNVHTRKIRGVYNDRRKPDEYPPGADFSYL